MRRGCNRRLRAQGRSAQNNQNASPRHSAAKVSPSPGGEGWGEGGRSSKMISSPANQIAGLCGHRAVPHSALQVARKQSCTHGTLCPIKILVPFLSEKERRKAEVSLAYVADYTAIHGERPDITAQEAAYLSRSDLFIHLMKEALDGPRGKVDKRDWQLAMDGLRKTITE